jgi:thermitase
VRNEIVIVCTSSSVASAAQYFMSKGGVVTISAGNESTFFADAYNPYALTVSATDSADALTSFSNTGNNVDLGAPGVSILTTNRGGGYGSWSGTSFSAPIVAGVAALVLSANPTLSGATVQDILKQTADDRGTAGWDTAYGYGRVNAYRAVLAAMNPSAPDTAAPTTTITSPSTGSTVSGVVTVNASASDNVGVTEIVCYADGVLIGRATSSPASCPWDTTTHANGSATVTARAYDGAGNFGDATVAVTVGNGVAVDTTAPSILIVLPANGTVVSRTVSVTVSASDDRAVTNVELYVDGKLTATSTSAPFTTNWNPRKVAAGAHTLLCRAYDAAGNAGTSQTVTVYR